MDRIEKTVELKAPLERVWRALTEAEEFGAWFGVRLENGFAPGEVACGRIVHPGYEHLAMQVTVVTMDRPRLFSFTWHPYAIDPAVDYSAETPTLVEFRLEPCPTGTRLRLTESGFDAVPEHRRAEALWRNDDGWTQQMTNIRRHVER